MLSCKQASQLISQSLDRRLSLRERLALRLHLLICDVCERFRQQLLLLRDMVHKLRCHAEQDADVQLTAAARQRIAARLEHSPKPESGSY
ncbi:zf-HC2 domain-containing protein [Methylobacillus flagellatus]|uniref:zf-HC2 domain-containing protein n=1 Tax=Methylobacillus flagellatus TaxID=405 RepID=UPI0010F9FE7E|nr:zf-HC2 domain-containing protein [Methylobacillus flagellatus]